jgi:hypothetical protein
LTEQILQVLPANIVRKLPQLSQYRILKVSRGEDGEGTNVGDVELAASIGTTTSRRTSWAHAIATASASVTTSTAHVAAETTARAAAGCGESRFRFTVLIVETHHVRCLRGLNGKEREKKKKKQQKERRTSRT